MATLAMFFRRPLAAPAAPSGAAQSRPVPISVPVDDRCGLRALPNEDIFLYSKPIDNSRVVREPQPTAHGEWSMIGTASALALLFMGLSTPRVANIFAGYQLESLKQEQQHLLDEQGDDLDQRVIDWLADEFKKQEGIDLRKDPMALQRLKEAAEKAKMELSTAMQTEDRKSV